MTFLVADDHDIVRIGVKLVLQKIYPGANIDEATSFSSVYGLVKNKNYDLAILDIHMNETTSIQYLKQLLFLNSDLKIIILSYLPDEIFGFQYIKAGAKAYIYKKLNALELERAIETVIKGDRYTSSVVEKQIEQWAITGTEENNIFSKLSERELEVFNFLLQGIPTSEISEKMHLHHTTICTYKNRIFDKLKTNNLMVLNDLAMIYNLNKKA